MCIKEDNSSPKTIKGDNCLCRIWFTVLVLRDSALRLDFRASMLTAKKSCSGNHKQ